MPKKNSARRPEQNQIRTLAFDKKDPKSAEEISNILMIEESVVGEFIQYFKDQEKGKGKKKSTPPPAAGDSSKG